MNVKSYSQLKQDLWVLENLKRKTAGTFIEIGASDGIHLSNTYLLEQDYGWNGLCVEPSSRFSDLEKNRNCHVLKSLLFSKSGMDVEFTEDVIHDSYSSFSGITETIDNYKVEGKKSIMRTFTLTEILDQLNFPLVVDYLSIDTEGSELHILEGVDFERYHFSLITVEHNHVEPKRSQIRKLLHSKGYQQDVLSDSQFDDWYIHNSLLHESSNGYFDKAQRLRNLLLNQIPAIYLKN